MPGRTFLQIPGPTLVPERIVRAMSQPIIDHRGPKFGAKGVFKTRNGRIVLYPGSGTGAWEAALVNTLSPEICTSAGEIETIRLFMCWHA
jgi:alanine-glyoxylate transaminase/serine-glyoxylate transaminase/serine-pyruvate transaminase